MTQKRNDRTFKSYEKKLEERSGITMKEMKEIAKQERKNLDSKKSKMLEKQAVEKA